ncbi:MAG: hypothetical protein E6I52_21700, partial [Chloroflexi bacterium]
MTAVANATGLQRLTIRAGIRELQAEPGEATGADSAAAADRVQRVRAPGGGRKPLTTEDPTLVHDLEALVEPVTRGDPRSPLRWTCTSTRQLAAELVRQGHQVSHQTVADVLHALDDSLPGTRTTKAGADHPDRDAQFVSINEQTRAFPQRGQPPPPVATGTTDTVFLIPLTFGASSDWCLNVLAEGECEITVGGVEYLAQVAEIVDDLGIRSEIDTAFNPVLRFSWQRRQSISSCDSAKDAWRAAFRKRQTRRATPPRTSDARRSAARRRPWQARSTHPRTTGHRHVSRISPLR